MLGAFLLAWYFWMLRTRGPQHVQPGEPVATRGQIRNAILAVVLIQIGAQWPMHDLAEGYLYSVHMIQHLIFTLGVAPLLLCATPPWMARMLLPGPCMRAARALSRPIVALAIFNVTIVFTHWPTIVDLSLRSELFHFAMHTVLVLTAMLMWMPVLSPVIEIPRLSYPGQLVYLFLQSLVPTVPASFLTFGAHPLYPIYAMYPHPWGISTLADQRTAGVIMKLAGGGALWAVITVLFFKWHAQERDGVDALSLRDVDASLNRMELRH